MSGPAHRVQSAVEEYGYPHGHLGHLSPDQEAALHNFKAFCAEKGYYKPETAGEDASHDDATLLRFLRARRFSVNEAFKQFQSTEDWRKANQLDTLYETIDLEHYDETRRLYPQWTGRRDRRGIPVYIFEVKHLNSKAMAAYEKSAKETSHKATTDGKTPGKLLRLFALYENLTRFVMPLCTAMKDRENPRTPITQSNNIVDISGVGLKQFWNLRAHMQDASELATAHYPETLDRIFIIGAPSFFPTVWSWIKRWFDPITTSKIFILSSADMKKTLESFIDPANIPKKYGGGLEWNWGDLPVLDPALKDVASWEDSSKDFPAGPMYWVNQNKGQQVEAIAVGSAEGKQREEKVCTVNVKLPESVNGHATEASTPAAATISGSKAAAAAAPNSALLEAPTAAPSIASTSMQNLPTTAATDSPVVQSGEVMPESRPEPVSFVTAREGLDQLHLSENTAPASAPASNGPHSTATANLLDPSVNSNKEGGNVPATEEHAHHSKTEDMKEKVHHGIDNMKAKVGL